jgi:dynein light chain LC8-type
LLFFQDVARYITGEFGKKYKPIWHCIVGPDYETWVTYVKGFYIKFKLGEYKFLLFKSSVDGVVCVTDTKKA